MQNLENIMKIFIEYLTVPQSVVSSQILPQIIIYWGKKGRIKSLIPVLVHGRRN